MESNGETKEERLRKTKLGNQVYMYTSENQCHYISFLCLFHYLFESLCYLYQYLFMLSCFDCFIADFLRRVEVFGFLFVMK